MQEFRKVDMWIILLIHRIVPKIKYLEKLKKKNSFNSKTLNANKILNVHVTPTVY